jgi:hypothetical protein
MSELAQVALISGGIFGIAGLGCSLAPTEAGAWIRAFPRNRWAGWVLLAADLVWSGWLLLNTPLGRFEGLKPLVYVLVPVLFFLIASFMSELLAARALGGLLALLPAPMLAAARWHGSPWRLLVVVLAYVLAVKGMVLLLSPYQFRRAWAVCVSRRSVCRGCGIAWAVVGAVLFTLALTVY